MGAQEDISTTEATLQAIFRDNDLIGENPLTFKSKRQVTEDPVDGLDAHMRSFMFHDVCLSPDSRVEGYLELERVLCAAYEQASAGKGKERHAAGDNFNNQPILTIGRLLKSADGEAYQAIKKTREALMMHRRGNTEAAIKELLGAINYLAAVAILVSEEGYARDLADFERVSEELDSGFPTEVEVTNIFADAPEGMSAAEARGVSV